MAIGATIGGVSGGFLSKTHKTENALLWASLTASLTSTYFLSKNKPLFSFLKEKKGGLFDKNKLLRYGTLPTFSNHLPQHLKHLVVESQWYLYELDEDLGDSHWRQIDEFQVLRKNHLF